jgi:hypothetical protein
MRHDMVDEKTVRGAGALFFGFRQTQPGQAAAHHTAQVFAGSRNKHMALLDNLSARLVDFHRGDEDWRTMTGQALPFLIRDAPPDHWGNEQRLAETVIEVHINALTPNRTELGQNPTLSDRPEFQRKPEKGV